MKFFIEIVTTEMSNQPVESNFLNDLGKKCGFGDGSVVRGTVNNRKNVQGEPPSKMKLVKCSRSR